MKRTISRSTAQFYLNGEFCEVGADQAGLMVSEFLRARRQLTGTKVVCAEGDCGACTVLKLTPITAGNKKFIRFLPVNSCILTVAQLDGSSLVTIEALTSGSEKLTPVQHCMRSTHASQCGFCTPGFVMALTGLVEKRLLSMDLSKIEPKEAMNATTGNLCRCTGYLPIIESATQIEVSKCTPLDARFATRAQLKHLDQIRKRPLTLTHESFTLHAPTSLKMAQGILRSTAGSKILGAGTDLGVVHNKGISPLQQVVSLHLVSELHKIEFIKTKGKTRVRVGARATLSELRDALEPREPEFAKFLDLFASPQIKNSATLIGNIANGSPIADTPPFLLTANTVVHVQGPKAKRSIPFERFFLGYRKTALKAHEWIEAVEFDLTQKELFRMYKHSQRKDLDISTVNGAFRLFFQKGTIQEARLALGGVAATPVRLKKTEALLKKSSLPLDAVAIQTIVQTAQSEIHPISDLRGTSAFRRALVTGMLFKFFREELSR